MRHILKFSLLIIALSVCLSGCEKDNEGLLDKEEIGVLDEDGLTKEINDILPKYILNTIRKLGMPIYGGGNPPLLTNGLESASYFVSPYILVASNHANDIIGMKYADMTYKFEKQGNQKITVFETAEHDGHEAYIVGDNNQFSVFWEVVFKNPENNYVVKYVYILSGTLMNDGIKDLYLAGFMVDNDGDPTLIKNGEGRVFYDEDGFSELLSD